MSLELGIFLSSLFLGVIFLSSLFLGVIFLFVSTKDRWNWKKILLIWPLCIVLVVGVVGGVAFYIYNQYENRLKVYDAYLDISLNTSESDLMFLKGDGYTIKDYTKDKRYVYYHYEMDDKYSFDLRLRNNKMWRISCHSDNVYGCPSLNTITLYDSADEIKEKLGEPDIVNASDDNLERMWIYKNYNIYMMLSKGKIDGYGIFEPSLGIPEYNDIEHDYRDFNKFKFGDKKVTIKEIPFIVSEDSASLIDLALLNEIIDASSDGDEVVWSEYISLKDKRNKVQAKEEKSDSGNRFELLVQGDREKWFSLKEGMTMFQVETLLGKPLSTEGGVFVYWYYTKNQAKSGAHVYFYVQKVSGWKMP